MRFLGLHQWKLKLGKVDIKRGLRRDLIVKQNQQRKTFIVITSIYVRTFMSTSN